MTKSRSLLFFTSVVPDEFLLPIDIDHRSCTSTIPAMLKQWGAGKCLIWYFINKSDNISKPKTFVSLSWLLWHTELLHKILFKGSYGKLSQVIPSGHNKCLYFVGLWKYIHAGSQFTSHRQYLQKKFRHQDNQLNDTKNMATPIFTDQ